MSESTSTKNREFVHEDLRQYVTDTIIEQLEKGTIPWQKPWAEQRSAPFTIPQNAVTGTDYQGINIVLLWSSVLKNSFSTQEWASFKQWQKKNEFIRKGEKGSIVVYYDMVEREEDGEKKKIPFLKRYKVFNRCQLESYQPDTNIILEPEQPTFDRTIDEVEQFVAATEAKIESHTGGAVYSITQDKILMPYFENFHDTLNCTSVEGYYATLFHELTHWTGAKNRLDRINHKKFGDRNYAAEELAAEFGAAFLCAGFGLATCETGNHAAYIKNWLEVLRNDKTILFNAAGAASKAVDYLNKLQLEVV